MARITLKIEVELSGEGNGWTDITGSVHEASGVDGSRGIRTARPTDRVATTGRLAFSLINEDSAGAIGYYSPGHANLRSGFGVGIRVRVSVVIGVSTIELWWGRITKITPRTGQYKADRFVEVEARDYIDQLARRRLSGLDVEQTKTEHAVFDLIIDEIPVQPEARETNTGPDTFDYVFDLTRDEETFALTEVQRLALSALSLVYVKRDGTLVYEPRNLNRSTPSNPVIAIGEGDLLNRNPPTVEDASYEIVNLVQTIMSLRRVDVSTVVLYRSNQPIEFSTGGPFLVYGLFTDSGQRAFRAGGINLVTPVASTDYIFNTASDGTGTDVTSQVDVSATFSGNRVAFSVTNNSGATAYATTFQARGIGVLAQERMSFEDSDTDSITAIGENAISVDMPYQSSTSVADESAKWLLHVLSQELRRLRSVPLYLDPDDEERAALIARRDISDLFTFTESVSALSGDEFFINAVDFSLQPDGTVWVFWVPAVADSVQFWLLEIVGRSEIDQTTRLGFGFIEGHTDVAHADGHGDTAHVDTAHVDTAHGDAGHGDGGHSDTAHSDTAHTDTHSDTAHGDTAHSDTAHADSHSDTAHGDIAHSDTAHTDGHGDSHNDSAGPHVDTHIDTHGDAAHADSHTDDAHADSHNDTAHSDTAHGDSHTDSHGDTAHSDVSHGDGGHTDSAHDDVAHGDTAHSDTDHADTHDDTAHGDVN